MRKRTATSSFWVIGRLLPAFSTIVGMEEVSSTATSVAWRLFHWGSSICVGTFVTIFSWFFSTRSSLLFCCWRKFTRFVEISFVFGGGETGRSDGGRGTSSACRGVGGRIFRFIFAEGCASIATSRIMLLSFPFVFSDSRIRTVRSWRIGIAWRDSCAVKERLVVVFWVILLLFFNHLAYREKRLK